MFNLSNKNSIIKIILVGGGNVLNAALGFLYLSSTARHLNVSEFGKYAILASLLVSLSKMLDFGTNSLFVAGTLSDQEKGLKLSFFSSKFILFLITLPIALVFLSIFHLLNGQVFLIFLIGLIAYGINYTLFGLFQSMEQYIKLVVLNLLPALIKGTFAVFTILGFIRFGHFQFFSVFALSILASSLMIFFVPKGKIEFKLVFSHTGNFIKKAFSPGISQVVTEIIPTINNAIAKAISDFSNVGIYALADKIANTFTIASFSIFTVLLPRNASRKRLNKDFDFYEASILGLFLILGASIVLAAAFKFIPAVFDNKYNDSISLLSILVFASAFSAIQNFLETYFFVENQTKVLIFLSLGKLTLLITLATILSKAFSIKGIAYSQFITSFISLISVIILISPSRKKVLFFQERRNL